MDQKPITYLFYQVLTMYIHIPSGPFLDDHASRIKEDGFLIRVRNSECSTNTSIAMTSH